MKRKGFTLIEILVVVAILAILVALTIIGLAGVQNKAKVAATKGIIGALTGAIEEYYETFKEYPPDGYDGYSTIGRKGSASLVYYLCQPITYTRKVGPAGAQYEQKKKVGPFFKGYKRNHFTVHYTSDDQLENGIQSNSQLEFQDGWKFAIEYDRVGEDKNEDGVLDTSEEVSKCDPGHTTHLGKAAKIHANDPRFKGGSPSGLLKAGAGYFLWSNGTPQKQSGWEPKNPIGNWNISSN